MNEFTPFRKLIVCMPCLFFRVRNKRKIRVSKNKVTSIEFKLQKIRSRIHSKWNIQSRTQHDSFVFHLDF